jgi:hypothetical protein
MAFHKKDFAQAMHWLEKSTAQGYMESVGYLKSVIKSGYEQELKDWAAEAVVKLEKIEIQWVVQLQQGEVLEEPIQETTSQEKVISNGEAVQESAQHERDEESKAEELEEDASSHDKQVLCLVETIYNNPQSVSEAQIGVLINHVEKKISAESITPSPLKPDSLPSPLSHDQSLTPAVSHSREINPLPRVAQEMLLHPLSLSQEEERDQRTVTLSREAIVDEKLTAQARYFVQEGVIFDTLRESVREGGADITGDVTMKESRAESFWASLPDFGHSLDALLQGALGHDVLHVDVDSYFG